MAGCQRIDARMAATGAHRYVAEEVLRLRFAQMIINERLKRGEFKIPIHLALGHEAIAVAVSSVMGPEDQLVLSHRNLHYNLARSRLVRPIVNEFLLRKDGLAAARLGSMNLANTEAGIVYTSSILGNPFCVAAGVALGAKVRGSGGVVIVVGGDGSIEEGAFSEALTFLTTYDLAAIVLLENNGWSLATHISERRCEIRLDAIAAAYDLPYWRLEGNDPYAYAEALTEVRRRTLFDRRPSIVEIEVHTLGDRKLKTESSGEGKYINYHAGPAPTVTLTRWPVIREDRGDPVFILLDRFESTELRALAEATLNRLEEELR